MADPTGAADPLQFFEGPIGPILPPGLAGAIEAVYRADGRFRGLSTDIYNSTAGDSPVLPYLVFKIGGGGTEFASSSSTWSDRRIRFECLAATADAAEALAQAVIDAYLGEDGVNGLALDYATGMTTPLILKGRSDQSDRARTRQNARVWRNTVELAARARLGRPS